MKSNKPVVKNVSILQSFKYGNGNTLWEQTYLNGVLNGSTKNYWKDGTLYAVWNYINNIREGECIFNN